MSGTLMLSGAAEDIEKAAELIKQGLVVGIPTETVYGLGGNALDPEAVNKIFAAKGRPNDNPLIVHIHDISQAGILARNIPGLFYSLAESFWPGPLTMIVPKNDIVPAETSGGLDTVGIRMPSHPVMRELIKRSVPIAAPSANRSGYPSPTTARHVMDDMDGRIAAVIDGGECGFGVESTVICFDDERTVRILRPGCVTREMLLERAGKVIIDDAILNDLEQGRDAPSPGMKYRHYSPKADVKIVEGSFDRFRSCADAFSDAETICLIFDSDSAPLLRKKVLKYGDSSEDMARLLFARLREADDIGAKTVLVRCPDKKGVGLAVYNRLLRAAAFEVI